MKEKICMIVFVLILGSTWTTALVVVDKYTRPYIEKYQAEKLRKSVLGAFGISYEGQDIEAVFSENVDVIEKGDKTIYRTKSGAIAFNITGSGSQGPISGVMALESDLKTIKGITIVSHVETPGLGDRVLEKKKLDTFKGKKIVPQLEVIVAGTAEKESEVQGITGATLTSKAFEKLINTESKEYISLVSEGE